ncbi:hypothetical protein C8R45DRAFT_837735, partial [Mycena sanguinolenta]
RPAKVQWTHPFLKPLQPLSNQAAQQTFLDITDNSRAIENLDQLLSFADNMPLAVDLMAHLVDYEGSENILVRWKTEKTAMLSVGYDRRSNLDASISLSLSSPRISSDSKELLSLLSILPNGLSDAELVQCNLPISNIRSCKAALLATSLAYQNSDKRLMVLMPVREHIQCFLPPSPCLVHTFRQYFETILELYQKYNDSQLLPVISQITANLGNLQEVLHRALYLHDSYFAETVYCTISLSSFHRVTGRGLSSLMQDIQHLIHPTSDHRLEIQFITEVLRLSIYYPQSWMDKLIVEGMSHCEHINDSLLEGKYYRFLKYMGLENYSQILLCSCKHDIWNIKPAACFPA